jgi:hypothetical protein
MSFYSGTKRLLGPDMKLPLANPEPTATPRPQLLRLLDLLQPQ